MPQLTKILAIAIMVFVPISSYSHDDDKHSLIGESKADKLDQCRAYRSYAKTTF